LTGVFLTGANGGGVGLFRGGGGLRVVAAGGGGVVFHAFFSKGGGGTVPPRGPLKAGAKGGPLGHLWLGPAKFFQFGGVWGGAPRGGFGAGCFGGGPNFDFFFQRAGTEGGSSEGRFSFFPPRCRARPQVRLEGGGGNLASPKLRAVEKNLGTAKAPRRGLGGGCGAFFGWKSSSCGGGAGAGKGGGGGALFPNFRERDRPKNQQKGELFVSSGNPPGTPVEKGLHRGGRQPTYLNGRGACFGPVSTKPGEKIAGEGGQDSFVWCLGP